MNRVVKTVCDVDVKQSLSNANSDILCATCNKSMFDGVHDKCLLDLVQNGNKRKKYGATPLLCTWVLFWAGRMEKSETFDWGEEREREFQTFKDKLCNAPILALLNGPKYFVVYYDASGLGLGCVLMQRGKANVVADALSRMERIKPKRIRSMNMTLQSSIKDKILAAHEEASDESVELQRGLDEMIERRSDGALYYLD
ncbi:putative reverse transcriptase domain-containing protein [Tanacetum coccineum]